MALARQGGTHEPIQWISPVPILWLRFSWFLVLILKMGSCCMAVSKGPALVLITSRVDLLGVLLRLSEKPLAQSWSPELISSALGG